MEEKKKTVAKAILEEFRENPEIDVATVMKKYSVSRAYVYRLKAKVEKETKEKAFSMKHDIKVPEKVQGVSPIKYYWAQLEDDKEGWTFWADQGDILYNSRAVAWIAIFYPEKEEKDLVLIDDLSAFGVQFAWILHDKDFWDHDSPPVLDKETGEVLFEEGERYHKNDPKKKHVHLLLKFDSVVTDKYVKKLLRKVFGEQVTLPIVCHNIRGYFNYLIHDTDSARKKGKFQYPPEKRICENGFHAAFDDEEKAKILAAIDHYINFEMRKEQHGFEYWMLIEKFDGQWDILKLIRGSTNHYQHLLDSKRNYYKQKDEQKKQAKATIMKGAFHG